jgi:hypothetical protein
MRAVVESGRSTFTIAVVCDTQNYVSYKNQTEDGFPLNLREMLWDQMQFIARNTKKNGGDIVFVTALGDSWQHYTTWDVDAPHRARGLKAARNPVIEGMMPPSPKELVELEIPTVTHAYRIIADAVPFSVVPGNHDHDNLWTDAESPPSEDGWVSEGKTFNIGALHCGSLVNWTKTFGSGSEFFRDKPWYIASFRNGANSAQIFYGADRPFLHLGLEMAPDDEVLEWARSVLESYRGLPTIVSTHEFLDPEGRRQSLDVINLSRLDPERNNAEAVWSKFIAKHDQIIATFNGHFHGAMHRIDRNDHGHKVYQFLVDYQGRKQSVLGTAPDAYLIDGVGDGWLRLMTFDFSGDHPRLRAQTYSTHFKAYSTNLPRYADWYRFEHPEFSDEAFAAEDHFELELDDFYERFGGAAEEINRPPSVMTVG